MLKHFYTTQAIIGDIHRSTETAKLLDSGIRWTVQIMWHRLIHKAHKNRVQPHDGLTI